MKCTAEEKEERLKAQKEAQKRMEEKKALEKENRLKELADEKEKAMLKQAKSKKSSEGVRVRQILSCRLVASLDASDE